MAYKTVAHDCNLIFFDNLFKNIPAIIGLSSSLTASLSTIEASIINIKDLVEKEYGFEQNEKYNNLEINNQKENDDNNENNITNVTKDSI